MAHDPSGETRGLGVHAQLREEILAGMLAPGSRLKVASLAGRFDVSASVVREALTRLTEQGLVLSAPHAGFRVKPVSAEDSEDLTRLRTDIDLIGLRRSIEQGSMEWEARLVAAHHRLAKTAPFEGDDPARLTESWATAHADFHQALIEGSASPRLLELAASLRDAAEIYRRWSFRSDGRSRDVAGEHKALLDATLDRDLDRASDILSQHLQRTADSLGDELRTRDLHDAAPAGQPPDNQPAAPKPRRSRQHGPHHKRIDLTAL